jgi:hypothetical protein
VKTRKSLTLTLDKYDKQTINYTGRCLGLVDDIRFAEIISDKTEANKYYTQETKSLEDILKTINDSNHKPFRVAMVVKTKNRETVEGKALFFTNSSAFYTKSIIIGKDKSQLSFYCVCGADIVLTETEEPKE